MAKAMDPPREGTSILAHIRAHLKADGSGLEEAGVLLPDATSVRL
jgi:hypothetical protein